jgi:hypothetical protein
MLCIVKILGFLKIKDQRLLEKEIWSKLTGAVTEKRILNSPVSGLGDPCNSDVLISALDHVGWTIFAVY